MSGAILVGGAAAVVAVIGFVKAWGYDSRPYDEQARSMIEELNTKVATLKGAGSGNKRDIAVAAYAGYSAEFTEELDKIKNDKKKTPSEKSKAYAKLRGDIVRRIKDAETAARTYPTDAELAVAQQQCRALGNDAYDRVALSGDPESGDQEAVDAETREMIAAIKARFGLEKLSGDFTVKSLRRLYELMKKVPANHIAGNTSLKEIRRDAVTPDASFYSGTKQQIVLNISDPDAYWWDETYTADDGTKRKVGQFDATTLHEIGHAVDDRVGVMRDHAGDHGGWAKTTIAAVATDGGAAKGFFAAFDQPRELLAKYLEKVLETGKAEPQPRIWQDKIDEGARIDFINAEALLKDDPGLKAGVIWRAEFTRNGAWPEAATGDDDAIAKVKMLRGQPSKRPPGRAVPGTYGEMLTDALVRVMKRGQALDPAVAAAVKTVRDTIPAGPPDATMWSAMAKHAAVKWCQSIRQTGESSGLWDSGKGGADKAKLADGRVVQQAYATEWWSYRDRAESVSGYQFRAPAEWFAELYVAYYMDWLPKTHWIGGIEMPPV